MDEFAYKAIEAQSAGQDRPYLARISDIADETRRIGDYVQDFIDRCRGGASADPGARAAAGTLASTGHLANLDRLTENLARLDKLARELQTIG